MRPSTSSQSVDLWNDVPKDRAAFDPAGQPPYLRHAIAPGTPLATVARLTMHGHIRLGRWRSFRGEEVLHAFRGFLWRARVGIVSGFDALLDGEGSQRWALVGVVPVVKGAGADVRRSSIGRWLLESVWLPSMLLPSGGARWSGSSVHLERCGEAAALDLGTDAEGRLQACLMLRWGDPGGLPFGYHPFGGVVEEERSFGGYTIPSRLRVGWHVGTDGWEGGEFFRVTIDDAVFR